MARKEIILTGVALQHARLIDSMITADIAKATEAIRKQAHPLLNALAMELGCPANAWSFAARGPDTVLSWDVPDIQPELPTEAAG